MKPAAAPKYLMDIALCFIFVALSETGVLRGSHAVMDDSSLPSVGWPRSFHGHGGSWARWLPPADLPMFPKLRPSPQGGWPVTAHVLSTPFERMLSGSKLASLLPRASSSFSRNVHFKRSRWAHGCSSSPSLLQLHRECSPLDPCAFFPSPKPSVHVPFQVYESTLLI